jgi:hypothetical protein
VAFSKEAKAKWRQRPEVQQRQHEYKRKWDQENKQRRTEYMRQWRRGLAASGGSPPPAPLGQGDLLDGDST